MSSYGQGFEEPEEGQQIKARLKWFNVTKGFGFVSPLQGESDAFLHVSVLHRAGLQELGDQAELLCEIADSPKGPQVLKIVEVLDAGQIATASSNGSSSASRHASTDGSALPSRNFDVPEDYATGPEEQVNGTVKWFKADKGFGFITIDGSGQDVFVHKSVLQRSGVHGLDAGQRVELRIHEVEKGREATWVSIS